MIKYSVISTGTGQNLYKRFFFNAKKRKAQFNTKKKLL